MCNFQDRAFFHFKRKVEECFTLVDINSTTQSTDFSLLEGGGSDFLK